MDAVVSVNPAKAELQHNIQNIFRQRYWQVLQMVPIAFFDEANQRVTGEYMITVLFEPREEKSAPLAYRIHGHVWPLPLESATSYDDVIVEVRGDKRIQPHIKHSSWVRDRQPLEKHKRTANAREILLSTSSVNGRVLLEGNKSFFFNISPLAIDTLLIVLSLLIYMLAIVQHHHSYR
jgi:hypothetical protein